jgi:hypothetical protein
MSNLLLAILLASLAFIILVIVARRPHYHRNLALSQVKTHLEALLKRGYNGGFIIIEDMHSDRFVQLAKYIKKKGDIGIELSFPKAPWSEQYYGKFKEWLRSEKIPFIIQAVDSTPVTEFIDIDCHSNIGMALGLVESIFKDIFKIREPLLRVRGEKISAKDVLIDS